MSSPGGGHDNPLQYSYLENSMDREATVCGGHKELDMTERQRKHAHMSSSLEIYSEFYVNQKLKFEYFWVCCSWVFKFEMKWSESHSVVSDSVTPWTVACQAPLSMEFSRQEYCSGVHALFKGTFPTQGSNPGLPLCRQILYCLSNQGSWWKHTTQCHFIFSCRQPIILREYI